MPAGEVTGVSVEDLRIEFPFGGRTWLPVVDGVSFEVRRGEVLGFVGESGSGKTMTALSLLGLVPEPGRITRGRIMINGREVQDLDIREWARLRGAEVGMVFQDALSGLNPVRSVGSLLVEAVRRHRDVGRPEARRRALDTLSAVGIPQPEERMGVYPHQLSGGLRQRVMIALAIINGPTVLVADEPTTALDATIQAQILDLLRAQAESRAVLLITHDIGVAAAICDRVAVVYSGRMAESGDVISTLQHPRHPYSVGLLNAVPRFRPDRKALVPIAGAPPTPSDVVPGCAFAPRCPNALERCPTDRPSLVADGHRLLACWNPVDD
ncbi:MAG: ABC transporter ATP-binding protein [Acidimicrobiia bacterium]|nr:ABC transporter ATP-binding protein [Acidimicrobiia bacterium]